MIENLVMLVIGLVAMLVIFTFGALWADKEEDE